MLHVAVESSDVEVLEWCLHFGFCTKAINGRKRNSLHVAASRGCYTRAELLITAEKDAGYNVLKFINSSDQYGLSPLYIAAKFGNKEVVKYFLRK